MKKKVKEEVLNELESLRLDLYTDSLRYAEEPFEDALKDIRDRIELLKDLVEDA